MDILNLTSEEKSRFVTGSIGTNVFLQPGHTSNVETQLGQQFGDVFVSQDIDTTNNAEYKYPFQTIGKLDGIARWNTKNAMFSSNLSKIMNNNDTFLINSKQTYGNSSKAINPYRDNKAKVLEKNAEDDRLKVTIGGINFLGIVKGLSDKDTASWDSVKPIGSAVNFYLFNSWEREITFDLQLYADNQSQLKQIWTKTATLSKLTKGKVTDSVKGVYGRIIELEIGDLISQKGFLSDISVAVDDTVSWDTGTGTTAPMMCTISVSFKVVTNGGEDYSFYKLANA